MTASQIELGLGSASPPPASGTLSQVRKNRKGDEKIFSPLAGGDWNCDLMAGPTMEIH